jgi:tRNA (guanine-N7-)-methyltransferase
MARRKSELSADEIAALRAKPDGRLFGRKKGKKLRPTRQAMVDAALPRLAITLPDPTLPDRTLPDREQTPLQPETLFAEPMRAIWLEVGFGGGEHLLAQARANPDVGFIGCEPFFEGAAKLIVAIEAEGLTNVRLFLDDARLLMAVLPDVCLDRAFLLFPDPWHKKRHHKRRFVTDETVTEMARLLAPGGEWRIASDIMDYIDWSLRTLSRSEMFTWTARQADDWRRRGAGWPATRYEEKALAQGRMPVYLTYQRNSSAEITQKSLIFAATRTI